MKTYADLVYQNFPYFVCHQYLRFISSFQTSLNPIGLLVLFGTLFIRFGRLWVNLQQFFGDVSVLQVCKLCHQTSQVIQEEKICCTSIKKILFKI